MKKEEIIKKFLDFISDRDDNISNDYTDSELDEISDFIQSLQESESVESEKCNHEDGKALIYIEEISSHICSICHEVI